MFLEYLSPGFLAAKWIYHRFVEDDEHRKKAPNQEIQVPRSDDGSPIPLVFGRCRVRAPILAWTSDPYTADADDETGKYRVYALDMLFIAGIPMGQGVTRGNSLAGPKLHNVWWGDYKLPTPGQLPYFSSSLYYGQSVARLDTLGGPGRGGGLRGSYHWFGGWQDQSFTSPPSQVGDRMTAWGATGFGNGIPGLANMMCVSFTEMPEDGANPYFDTTRPDSGGTFEAVPLPTHGFVFGESPTVSPVSLEVSSYGDRINDVTGKHIFRMQNEGVDFGGDADPAEVIYALLVDKLGKLGYDASYIDTASFDAASNTLKLEGHGYSRAIEQAMEADALIQDVLRQIDGCLDEDPTTGKIVIKLVRPDWNPPDVPEITEANCDEFSGTAGGRANLVTKVKITFENRDEDYAADSEEDQNPTSEDVNEAVIDMPGVKRSFVAAQIASRELAHRSRPLIKARALVGREFARLLRGSIVKVTMPRPGIAGLYFRVANVERGTLENGKIALDLIQDASYVWGRAFPVRSWIPPTDTILTVELVEE